MNIANKLTLLRIILIPFYVLFLLVDIGHFHYWIAAFIFIVCAVTDALDGMIARKRQIITDFGKFADPLADKLLVLSALICFVQTEMMPAWICIIITAREIAINGIRLVCAEKGTVVSASILGKIKTISQMIFIILSTINIPFYFSESSPGFCQAVEIIRIIFMYLALVMTVVSFVDYCCKNRKAFVFKDI